MKKLNIIFLIRTFALIVTLNIVFAIFPGQISAQQNEVNFQEFYDQLSPYGQWIEESGYGYIWIPTAGPDFTPYLTNGFWALTDYGWMWVSGYDWGWVTFHYGRWDYNGFYGWFWVPDIEWGPSWVTWRRTEGYYGWAPMRPGVSINVTFSRYNDVPNDRWIFVIDRDIERHDLSKNHISRKNNSKIIKNSTVINKTYYDDKRHSTYVSGPDREEIQKIIGRTIKSVAVLEKNKSVQSLKNDQMQVYMPRVQRNNSGFKPAPSELTNFKDVKQITERDAVKQTQNINMPKNYDSTDKPPKARTQNQPNNKGMDQPSKSDPNDDKKGNRKP